MSAVLLLCLAASLLGGTPLGCASTGAEPTIIEPSASASSSAAAPSSGAEVEAEEEAAESENPDPFEKMNRGIFWFNETADIYLILPIAKAWRFVFPLPARTALRNLSDLSRMSVILANNMLQLEPGKARDDVFRIVFNASFGIGGLIDVATMVDIPDNDEDFGQTLGFWGVPPGPYIVLPIFGPANVRDGLGRAVDVFGTLYSYWVPLRVVSFFVNVGELMNLRARFIEEVDENRRESFDYYVFMRDAYTQNRKAKLGRSIWLGAQPEAEAAADEDFYFVDDEYDEAEYDEEEYEDEESEAIDGDAKPAEEVPNVED